MEAAQLARVPACPAMPAGRGACELHTPRVPRRSPPRLAAGRSLRCLVKPALPPLPWVPHAPSGYLLLPGHRSELAAALNRAILAHSGRSEDSALEAAARQAGAVLQVHGLACQGAFPPAGWPRLRAGLPLLLLESLWLNEHRMPTPDPTS